MLYVKALKYVVAYVPVAVVWCRPHGQYRLIEVPLVSFHDQLMCSADHVDVIGCVELGHHITTKQVTRSSGTHTPTCGVYEQREEKRSD